MSVSSKERAFYGVQRKEIFTFYTLKYNLKYFFTNSFFSLSPFKNYKQMHILKLERILRTGWKFIRSFGKLPVFLIHSFIFIKELWVNLNLKSMPRAFRNQTLGSGHLLSYLSDQNFQRRGTHSKSIHPTSCREVYFTNT